ncbi:hypothetical protein FACS1894156_8200 [Bacteroidia bacterium]|nr:hypothetical protein FACS1894156_8200 [Bacteroidia bacterium]
MKNLLKTLLLLATTLAATTHYAAAETAAAAPAAGTGAAATPYQIANLANLRWLSQTPAAWGAHFVQTANIDAAETGTWNYDAATASYKGFSPIGNYQVYAYEHMVGHSVTTTVVEEGIKFTGSYNGNGHTISNLYVNCIDGLNAGLFGYVDGVTLTGVGMLNVNITGQQAGGLVGFGNNSTITQCYTTGLVARRIYANGVLGTTTTGGLVGGSRDGVITQCYSSCRGAGGGLIGFLNNEYSPSSSLKNCYATGSVSGSLVGRATRRVEFS